MLLLSSLVALLSLSPTASGLATRKTPDFLKASVNAAHVLQKLFWDQDIGLWRGFGPDAHIRPDKLWLSSASCLGVLGLLGSLDNATAPMVAQIAETIYNNGADYSTHVDPSLAKKFSPKVHITDKFINENIASMLLWGLSFNHAFDLTGDSKYLDIGIDIFQQVAFNHYNATCGGVWADPEHTRMDAITNNEMIALATHIATRSTEDTVKAYYLDWAQRIFAFVQSHLIGPDGLELREFDHNCKAVGEPETYTNGVLIGGLLEFNKLTPNESFVDMAKKVGKASIEHFSDKKGIITEPGSPRLGINGGMKKGLYIRHIVLIASLTKEQYWIDELVKQAESIMETDTSHKDGTIGILWDHYLPEHSPSGQCGGLDALVGAATVV